MEPQSDCPKIMLCRLVGVVLTIFPILSHAAFLATHEKGIVLLHFLHEFSTESHADERLAEKWHLAHTATYLVLIVLYIGASIWHLGAAGRHRHTARLLEAARRVGVADNDQGC